MADVFSKSKRSEVMARIRSHGNQATEVALAKFFRRHKITGWRRQIQVRIGECGVRNQESRARANLLRTPRSALRIFSVRPDFIFPPSRTAVFVDGCFWHGCPQHGTQPKGNRAFWKKKFARNKTRDRLVTLTLRKSGWRVLRIWEHTLRWATMHRATLRRATKKKSDETRLLRRIQRALQT